MISATRICQPARMGIQQPRNTSSARNAKVAATYKVTFQMPDGEQTIECPEDSFILDAGLDAGLDLPYSCRSGVCTTCTAKLVKGDIDADAVQEIGDDTKAMGYHLICSSYPMSDMVLETHKQDELQENQKANVMPQAHTEGY